MPPVWRGAAAVAALLAATAGKAAALKTLLLAGSDFIPPSAQRLRQRSARDALLPARRTRSLPSPRGLVTSQAVGFLPRRAQRTGRQPAAAAAAGGFL
jgi:hypothetical protein